MSRKPNVPREQHRVLRWRDAEADYSEIGARFRRSAGHVQRIETLARYKLARSAADATAVDPVSAGRAWPPECMTTLRRDPCGTTARPA